MQEKTHALTIKCPSCGVAYKLPKDKIGANPRRMRCAKCHTAFTIARRTSIPPAGLTKFKYEEFVNEAPNVPSEFGFLVETPDASASAAPTPERPAIPPPKNDKPTDAVDAFQAADASPETTPESFEPKSEEVYFDEDDTSWISRAPLDLNEFSIGQASAKTRRAGKIVTGAVGFIIIFFIFVAFRNGWQLSVPDLSSQVAFAFSTRTFEKLPDEVKGLEVNVYDRRTLIASDGRPILVVLGDIQNNAPTRRTHILLRGRVLDDGGTVRAETKLPCGVMVDDIEIKATAKGGMREHFLTGASPYNCDLRPEGFCKYKLVFDPSPETTDSLSNIEVVAIAARHPGE
ncbi:MAG: zinc-ribbon domain-containing protein [Myxococcota bacterium]|nr:zinc-ribbon domain-containing protein [Myxococcota bacterium]